MAVNPIGSNPIGTVVPPGVSSNAAEVLRLRAQLDLVHSQLMSGMRFSPQRLADLLNAYLDTVRRLHPKVTLPSVKTTPTPKGAAVDVCITPTPGGPVPMPYPNIAAPTTKADPATQHAQKAQLNAMHQQIKSSSSDAPGTSGVLGSLVKKTCEYMMYSFDVKFEGKNVCRLSDPLFHNRHS
jgi:hypothetical protein